MKHICLLQQNKTFTLCISLVPASMGPMNSHKLQGTNSLTKPTRENVFGAALYIKSFHFILSLWKTVYMLYKITGLLLTTVVSLASLVSYSHTPLWVPNYKETDRKHWSSTTTLLQMSHCWHLVAACPLVANICISLLHREKLTYSHCEDSSVAYIHTHTHNGT